MNWESIWNSIKDFFNNNIWGVVKFITVLVIGIIVIKIVLNIFKRVLDKTKMEKITQGFLYAIIKFFLYLALILILLNLMGISMTGVLTAISALLLAVGMALQSNISNVANGIVIISSHMFKKGDYVSVDDVEGSVHDINFLFTTIMTTDNKKITVPNSAFVNNAVTNYGANDTRRVDFSFDVAYESDVDLVRNIILEVIKSNGKVRLEKAPFCRLKRLDSSSINFAANCWVDSEDYWDVYYYVIENVFNEFKRNNVSIPYNQMEIRERKDNVKMPVKKEKLQARVEKERKRAKHLIDLENDDLMSIFKIKKNPKDKKSKEEKVQENKKESTQENAKVETSEKDDLTQKNDENK